jgi:exopolyphosphatase / guanosine-5'-triphosphate,3'-diphosphate pyrophosphatase
MSDPQPAGGPAAAKIVPRWEWRTFAADFGDFGAAARELTTLPAEQVQDSDEVYLVSSRSDASCKLRDGLVDVKHLEQVDADGFELWRPVMKSPFPLSAEHVRLVLRELAVDVPPLTRDSYGGAEFADEIVKPHADLLGVRLHKQRRHYRVDDCMVELTQFDTNGMSVHTIAIESPDRALVRSTIRRLGLAGRRNVNVARGLKTLMRFGSRRGAVIDVGTNSVKFFVGEVLADGSWQTVRDRADITRLGEGLEASGQLSDGATQRTVATIATMLDEARSDGVASDAVALVGTAGLRSASNRAAFDDALRTHCGVSVETISGDDEGRLAYLAATTALGVTPGRLVVFDSGGGSTQFTFGRGHDVDDRFSLDVGAVRVTERFGLHGTVDKDVLDDTLHAIARDLGRLRAHDAPDAVIGMGGTVTNLAAVRHGLTTYDPDVVQGTVLDLAEIDRQIEQYRQRDAAQRREIVGLQPDRADVILGGACIVRAVLEGLGHSSLTVSDRGLRHGVFAERFTEPRPIGG